ncbi:MAG: hypothetical protein ACOZE5_09345 [Verrucomicrobiota bacterium]
MTFFESTARFRACIKQAGLDRTAVFSAMQLAAAAWGQPHLHSGRGIRRLSPGLYECRLGRDTRLVFLPARQGLLFDFAGNHDEVRAYLKNRR